MALLYSIGNSDSFRNIRDCDIDVTSVFYYRVNGKIVSSLILGKGDLLDIEAYVKNNDGKEIMVKVKDNNKDKRYPWLEDTHWFDDKNNMYHPRNVYLKIGTKAWLKYHILTLHPDCVSKYIGQFDKHELFEYAVRYGRLPENKYIQQKEIPDDGNIVREALPIDEDEDNVDDDDEDNEDEDNEDEGDENMDKLSLYLESDDILPILTILKPDYFDEKYNDNILFIACKRDNARKRNSFKFIKFLVKNCGITLKTLINTGFFGKTYLLNEIVKNSNVHNTNKLYIFLDKITAFASKQTPPVSLVNQDVLEDAIKYRKPLTDKFKEEKTERDDDDITKYKDYYKISEDNGGYLQWLRYKISKQLKRKNLQQEPPQQSFCNSLTGCFSRRNKVHIENGGSKKRVKKTRKQRKHRSSKRNNKKRH
jgi:hypothetical protein